MLVYKSVMDNDNGGGSNYTAGDGIDITNDIISTKQSEEGDIDEIIDVYPQSGNLVSIVNAFNKGDIYSTEERMIGQWIDGKPLYQLVVPYSFTGVTARTYTNILDLTSYNIDTFVNAKGYIINSNSDIKTKSFPLADQYNRINAVYDRTTKYLQLLTYEVNGWILSGHVIIQYTKTTDTVISIGSETEYSTDEKVVGTWITGEPIWQRTIMLNSPLTVSYQSWTSTGITVASLSIDKFRGVKAYTNSGVYNVDVSKDGGNISLQADRNAANVSIVGFTIQYTKTTT